MTSQHTLDPRGKDSSTILLNAVDLELRPGGSVKFEGYAYGFESSFFHVKDLPGEGPPLHFHPYPETWIVIKGAVRFTVGGEAIEASPGNIIVAAKEIPHKFVNIGTEVLEMVCIHPSPNIIQTNLE
ncbi:MAG: cupin domain-containing protein [Anaerolineales bacterium]